MTNMGCRHRALQIDWHGSLLGVALYSTERLMSKCKGYIMSRVHPEACIMQGRALELGARCADAYVRQKALAPGEEVISLVRGGQPPRATGVAMKGKGKAAGGVNLPAVAALLRDANLVALADAVEGPGATLAAYTRARVNRREYRTEKLDESYTTTNSAVLARVSGPEDSFPARVQRFLEISVGEHEVHVAELRPIAGAAVDALTGLWTATGAGGDGRRYALCRLMSPLFYAHVGVGAAAVSTYFRYHQRGVDAVADAGEERDPAVDAQAVESTTAEA
jgi:hypothetical protein